MEITAKPRRRGRLRAMRAVLVTGALLVVALLIPPALGMETHVVGDHAMSGTHSRGSLVFDEQVSRTRLDVDDVITFVPPGADSAEGAVTRRIVAIDDTVIRTRGDAAAAADPWRLRQTDGDLERVVFSVPWAGYPVIALGALSIPPWTPAALLLALALGLVLLRRAARPIVHPDPPAPDPAVAAPVGASVRRPLA